jgi:hypothetical protein
VTANPGYDKQRMRKANMMQRSMPRSVIAKGVFESSCQMINDRNLLFRARRGIIEALGDVRASIPA